MNSFLFFSIFFAIVLYRILDNSSIASFAYILVSYGLSFDNQQQPLKNFHNEKEDEFMHQFIALNYTFDGLPVEVTYHIVMCGDEAAEPIVFGHGLAENWRVWKPIMREFCSTHRVVAIDSEGMGQSVWPNILRDIPYGNSTSFMASMQMQLLHQIGIRCFNLVITDYSFWTTLSMLVEYGDRTIIRYGKLQSV
jgi:hypothetical protein